MIFHLSTKLIKEMKGASQEEKFWLVFQLAPIQVRVVGGLGSANLHDYFCVFLKQVFHKKWKQSFHETQVIVSLHLQIKVRIRRQDGSYTLSFRRKTQLYYHQEKDSENMGYHAKSAFPTLFFRCSLKALYQNLQNNAPSHKPCYDSYLSITTSTLFMKS